ncbi:hypothetical protein PBAL39_17374 [Pedobacter sp. BAL39]|uniref:winged helix-turn-helix transcriptional regulator n=1 Tax=Pedobacter sp. BAL39 TaxID=391596 RepID=UPI000155A6C8|nr:helix-turn-helix domain-containing protein [Pedobacter sp. BAL39]EDM34228.1 hypothetical protein PBAL39_17374 [Pedobacter sp. BAL39]
MKNSEERPAICPIVKTMRYIGGKWKPIILARIEPGNVRFGRLTVQIPDISRKILTQQLKELEADGLILRHSYNEKPPRVEYELSAVGKTLIPVLTAMNEWATTLDDVK